jgi:hypothetical protein
MSLNAGTFRRLTMPKLVLNSELLAKLPAVTSETMIVNESGQIIGTFRPLRPADLEPKISEEELDRRSKSNERRYSTAEVLKHLESL